MLEGPGYVGQQLGFQLACSKQGQIGQQEGGDVAPTQDGVQHDQGSKGLFALVLFLVEDSLVEEV